MKKLIFVLCLVLGIGSMCFAASENVTALMNKQVKILYNDVIQEFQNVKGEAVYPLSFEGTTYLPIRAISSMFYTEIKWDGETNSIYLFDGELDETSARAADEFVAGENEEVEALMNQDVKIYIGEEVQEFTDVNGKVVYPLSYQGTTYLPVRAVSGLFGLAIDWDSEENAVLISEEILDEEGFSEESGEYLDHEIIEDDTEYTDDEFGGTDEELDAEAELNEDEYVGDEYDEDAEAIVVDGDDGEEDGMFIDENGVETYYFFADDDGVIFYQVDEDDNVFVMWGYDENGEIFYYE